MTRTPAHRRALGALLLAFVNALVLLVAVSVATDQVRFTVATPQVQIPLRLQVSGASVDSDPIEAVATGPVTTAISFQWRTAVGEVRHPTPMVVPAGTRVSLCLFAGVVAEPGGNTTCVSSRVRFRTIKAAVLDGEPCDIGIILSIYVSCGHHATVPAVPDGGAGLLPFQPNTEVYADFSRAVTVHNVMGDRAGATIHAIAERPVRATVPADVARALTRMEAQVTKRVASYGHARVVRLEQSPLRDIVLEGGRPRLVSRTRALFYTDEQLKDAVRAGYQIYSNDHRGRGAPDLGRIRVRTASVIPGTTRFLMTVEVSIALLNEYRVRELALGCRPSVCKHRLTAAGLRVVSVHHAHSWLRRVDLAARVHVDVDVDVSSSSVTPAVPSVR